MTTLSFPNSFSGGTPIQSSQVNANFAAAVTWSTLIDNGNIKSGANIALSKLDKTAQFLDLMTAGTLTVGSGTTGDTYPRVTFTADGGIKFGAGSASVVDMLLKRADANTLSVRDAADTVDKNLTAGTLRANTSLILKNTNLLTFTPASVGADRAITVKDPGASASLVFATGTLNANGLLYTDGTNILSGSAGSYSSLPSFTGNCVYTGGRLSAGPYHDGHSLSSTTLYYIPDTSRFLSVYDGSNWVTLAIPDGGVQVAIPATTLTLYFVYAYSNAGTLTLELSTTAPSTTYQNGYPVKSGDTTRRYLGVCASSGTSGQTSDTESFRGIWNLFNQRVKTISAMDTATNWSYATNTWRTANTNTTTGQGRIYLAVGALGPVVPPGYGQNAHFHIKYRIAFYNTAGAATYAAGIGVNSTTTPTAIGLGYCAGTFPLNGQAEAEYGTQFGASGALEPQLAYFQALETNPSALATTVVSRTNQAVSTITPQGLTFMMGWTVC